MKKLLYSITGIIAFAVSANAQVGIEIANENDISPLAILDFPDNAEGGIILPYVDDTSTAGTEPGTILYNAVDGVIYYQDNTNAWIGITPTPEDNSNIASYTDGFDELSSDGVIITDQTISEDRMGKGVLELESTNKALSLPNVNGVENIASPTTGMICYDTSRRSLAIYNGETWILRN